MNSITSKLFDHALNTLFWVFNAFLTIVAASFALAVLGIIALVIWIQIDTTPSDQAMIENFHDNRAVFEALREKICALPESQTVMMNPAWSRPVVTDQTRDEYYRLLERIDAKGVQSIRNEFDIDCQVTIEFWAKGWMVEADYKRYTFNDPTSKHDIVVNSLDNLPLHPTEVQIFRRELIDGWALQYAHWP